MSLAMYNTAIPGMLRGFGVLSNYLDKIVAFSAERKIDPGVREAIAASAVALLRERGIKASSAMDVMKGAGLTVGGFYSHYDSREDLFVETLLNAASANWDHLLKSAKGHSKRLVVGLRRRSKHFSTSTGQPSPDRASLDASPPMAQQLMAKETA